MKEYVDRIFLGREFVGVVLFVYVFMIFQRNEVGDSEVSYRRGLRSQVFFD